MNGNSFRPPSGTGGGENTSSGQELEKKLFHLKTLYEVTRELSGLIEVKPILDTFLPLSMGSLGATTGFLILDMEEETPRCEVAARGVNASLEQALCGSAGQLSDKIFDSMHAVPTAEMFRVFRGKHLSREPLLPPDTQLLIAFPVGTSARGMLGLGPRIDQHPYAEEDQELEIGLVRTLVTVLQNGLAHEEIRKMGQRLAERNAELRTSLEKMEATRQELDQRAFHLQQLYDTSVELSGLIETAPIMDTFLLLVLGAFAVQNGFLLVYDKAKDEPDVVVRGMDATNATTLSNPETRSTVMELFVSLKDRIPHIMESRWITDPELLERIPCPVTAAVLFTIDEECRGVLGLGLQLKDGAFSKDDHELMSLLLSHFMVSLDNARHFEAAQRLNKDLERRNAELEATLKDLTTARGEIDVLQSAKDRILGLVQSEKERAGKAVWLDFLLILVVSVVLGLLFNMASPGGISLVPRALFVTPPDIIALERATSLHKSGQAVFIDARPPEFFEQGHVPGAVNIPLALFDFVYDMKLSQTDPSTPLVVYGRTFSQHYDSEVAHKLELLGHDSVFLLESGLEGWDEKSHAVER